MGVFFHVFVLLHCSKPFHVYVLGWQGAAVAYVADILKFPVIFIKAVTNVVAEFGSGDCCTWPSRDRS